jgi:ribosomal protein S18 acetylase RimI-like enzyme
MATEPVEIRPAGLADLPALGRLLVTQLREHDVDLPEAEIVGGAEGMLRRPQRGRFLVAVAGEELIGFAALSFLWTLEHGGWAAWLDELYVIPARRDRGIGDALLRGALDVAAAAGARAVDLEIETGHERVESLYRRHGFATLTRSRWVLPLAGGSQPGASSNGSAPETSAAARELTGGCFCGAVRYRITAAPLEVSHCHCSICRRTSGAPFVTWATIPTAAFALVTGAPRALRSTAPAERQFCEHCGTALTFRVLAEPQWLDVTVGSLDDPGTAEPDLHIWTQNQVRWLHIDDDLPRHPERAPR